MRERIEMCVSDAGPCQLYRGSGTTIWWDDCTTFFTEGTYRATNVLIYGGAGAVGSTAVQIAKHYGVHVTAVCHERNIELVKRLGADVVVDYSREGYDRDLGTYDAVFDALGKIDKRLAKKHVAENGAFSSVAGQGPASERKEDLMFLNELFEAGELQPVIDSVYSLDEIVEAHRYVDQGTKVGNVVVKINEESIR